MADPVADPGLRRLPLTAAALAFGLNQLASYRAQLRSRWNVAINVHREATEACLVLPRLADIIDAGVPPRVVARETLFFYDDGSEGGVFKAFSNDLKTLPPSVAAAALRFFENYAFLSAMLLKAETETFRGLSVRRQLAVAVEIADAARAAAGAAHRTRILARLYMRGRYVPLLRTGPSAAIGQWMRGEWRGLMRWLRRLDRHTVQPGLVLPARPWRPEIKPPRRAGDRLR